MKEANKKNNEEKSRNWKRPVGVFALVFAFCFVMSLAIALNVSQSIQEAPNEPVSTKEIEFSVPMSNAVVVKDYAEDHLQYNASLNRWEIHLAVDLASDDNKVYACCDGVVTAIDSNSLDGYVVKIEHDDGFSSVYGSLGAVNSIKVGDSVVMGQTIGLADTTASNESKQGGHLHFTMFKDNVEVDPNNYLDLQNK